MTGFRWIFPKKVGLEHVLHVAYGTDYFKLRALTPLEDTISERLKKGRGEQVVFTTVGKPIWHFGAFVARNS